MSASGISTRSGRLGVRADGGSASGRLARIAAIAAVSGAGCLLASPAAAAGGALELVPDLRMVGLLVVLFLALVFPVNALLFKPIFRVLDERDAQLDGTRRRAAKLQKDAQGVLERYEESVRGVREEAEQERRTQLEQARSEGASTTGAARSEAESEVERARHEVASSLESARGSLREEAQDLARQAAARVLGRSV